MRGAGRTDLVQAHTSPLTFGLLVDRLDDEYSGALAFAFREEVASRGVRGICFVGHALQLPERQASNLAYELASDRVLDGLIVGSLGSSHCAKEERAFLERYSELPRCTYSVSVPGVPRVSVDHMAGMKAAVNHLIERHGHRRIAFLKGPETSLDSTLRYEGYCAALQEAGLSVEECLVVPGDFSRSCAAHAIEQLLDQRRLGFEALVAANDAMAMGAMDALRSRGIRVPRDVAVVGFDDVEDSRFARPPLSSVRNPWRAQVMLALDLVFAQIAGKKVLESPKVAADFVARASCGCGLSSESWVRPGDSLPPSVAGERDWLSGWAFSLTRNLRERNIELGQAVAGQIVFGFWSMVGGGESTFFALLEEELKRGLQQSASLSAWYSGLAQLKQDVNLRVGDRPELQQRAHQVIHTAFQRVSYAAERQQALRRLTVEQQGRWLAQSGERTLNAFEADKVTLALREPLRRLGIPSCFLARFVESSDERRACLVVASGSHAPKETPREPFSAHQILPEGVWPRQVGSVFVLKVLVFREKPLGYALFEMGPQQGAIYRGLAERLTASLKGGDLARDIAVQAKERQRRELDRLQGEVRVAREVQRWLLPSCSSVVHWQVAADLITGQGARAAYYDALTLGEITWLAVGVVEAAEGRAGLLIPVLQSLVASLCRCSAAADEVHSNAVELLRSTQRLQGATARAVSLVVVRLELTGELQVAGESNGVAIWGVDGTVRTGVADKVAVDAPQVSATRLEKGEALVLCTPHVPAEHLRGAFRANGSIPPASEAIVKLALSPHASAGLHDSAALVVRWPPSSTGMERQ